MPLSDWENYKEEVRAKSDILSVVGAHLKLRKVGRRFVGLCPFHSDTKPSFYVDPEKGIFHCFGCGAGGDVFSFVMQTEGLDFQGALALLARQAGVAEPTSRRDPEEAKRTRTLKERGFLALEQAQRDFAERLKQTPQDHPAVKFLKEREVAEKNWGRFGLGLAGPGWEDTRSHLSKLGFSDEEMSASGLISSSEKGGYYDFFRNRLTIAICEPLGKIVGFGGRSLDESEPKYLNSKESILFHKGRLLYPLHIAREGWKEGFPAILVEGYLDCISLLQQGIPGVVAPLGTALTEGQAGTITRFCEQVVICYDGDEAGKKATLRSLSLLLGAGLDVKVALMPEGLDPDDYIRANGARSLLELLGKAHEGWDHLIAEGGGREAVKTPEGRARMVHFLGEALHKLPPGVRRMAVVESICQKLHLDPSTLTGAIEEFSRQARRYERAASPTQEATEPVSTPSTKPPRYEAEFIALLLNYPQYIPRAAEDILEEGLIHPASIAVVGAVLRLGAKDTEEVVKELLKSVGDDTAATEFIAHCAHIEFTWDAERAYQDLIRRINQEALHRKIEQGFKGKAELESDISTLKQAQELARRKAHICEDNNLPDEKGTDSPESK